ncbi:type II toxin-antitoxin system Phd/YefM family antitoxin [Dyadobacter sp. CY343]|uniref:type II toxin-antitoxin system Phd/YefM family antitoxin n=1 Tax=Dyadobacter sp. CY343 TaxID=2907299 RepID=UPI001F3BDFA7|nr:type II toxin-antitoxin system Phd/YefM family antitoxin [Dyadobacter sp. CY343]MCE7062034.1 type II toxin-antitoxin system Phd/YefM family antitoxin [Dyadobacter sp. CY343]
MRTMSVGEFKAQFSKVLKEVEQGEKIGITFGRKKEVKAMLVPKEEEVKPTRKLGAMEGKAGYFMRDDFTVTSDDEFGA